jgi:hypothetical protein
METGKVREFHEKVPKIEKSQGIFQSLKKDKERFQLKKYATMKGQHIISQKFRLRR